MGVKSEWELIERGRFEAAIHRIDETEGMKGKGDIPNYGHYRI